ncbi:diguanylate cyclase [Zoogloea sp.]|uniref:GGDEF domain-containing protein n=1 Tax=Zoogloea sp. TaxID=49181 RepID=UPI0025F9B9B7|nr:diguanylate cyclase [Zoogloea sp.]MCK6394371.1 diguanylate cyclase [Zoogloea sp.]
MPLPVSALIGSPRRLVTAIVLFLVLDLTVLMINLWIAEQVAQDAVAINLAGRQRMLSQQITKALLLTTRPRSGEDARSARQETDEAFGLFEETLKAFAEGGKARGGDGTSAHLKAVDGEGARIVTEARSLITPLSLLLAATRAEPSAERSPAAAYMVQHNPQILALMNRLTTVLEHDSIRRTRDLRLIQSGAFALAMANFLIIVLGMARRYRLIEEDSQRWRAMARHDPLTGIANRKAFEEAASAQLMRAQVDAQPGAMLMLDLDGFKGINDRFGHSAGDAILRAVATRLEGAARATDVVARLGGDEFAILCPMLGGEDDVGQLCERLVDSVRGISRADIPGCPLGVSIGVALYPDDGYDPAHLQLLADRAMYAAKRAGGNRWHIA